MLATLDAGVEVEDFTTSLTSFIGDNSTLCNEFSSTLVILLAVSFCLKLVIIKEANQIALARLKRDLNCERVYTKLFDNFKNISLSSEFGLCVLLQPILARWLRTAATAERAAEAVKPLTAPIAVAKALALKNGLLQLLVIGLILLNCFFVGFIDKLVHIDLCRVLIVRVILLNSFSRVDLLDN